MSVNGGLAVLLFLAGVAAQRAACGDVQLLPPSRDVIVEFRDTSSALRGSDVREATSRHIAARFLADVPTARIAHQYSLTFSGVALRADAATIRTIEQLPYVLAVHSDERIAALQSSAPDVGKIATRTAPAGSGGDGVVVAVIDSGIDYTHPALGGGFGDGFKVAGGWDFVNDDADPMDDNRHGTHVAGIIAADGAELRGIAPGATLLAYKVLDASGSGSESDLLAAIERAADPNGDGDPADHVDVANLSLGGTGHPDDPASIAVDRATAHGIVFAAAAGNGGGDYAILSPGTARSAITVGAFENGTVAPFSSRGPCPKLATIKPDVLAPGSAIRSTVPGGWLELSGTSMAAAHVSGVCALLRELHPQWTPRQIKSAITMTATPVSGDPMTEGAGLVDLAAAANAPLDATASHFSLGLDALQAGIWRRAQVLTVANDTATPMTFTAEASGELPGVSVNVTPAILSVPPHGSASLALVVTVDHEFLTPSSSAAHAYGGAVTLTSESHALRVPWAFVNAAHVTLTSDEPFAMYYWLADQACVQPRAISRNTAEAFLCPGVYELAALSFGDRWSLVVRTISVAGEMTESVSRSDAAHRILLAGTDRDGNVLAALPGTYWSRMRIGMPPGLQVSGFDLVNAGDSMDVSSLRSGFTLDAVEMHALPDQHRVVAVQHPTVTAFDSSLLLSSRPYELRHHPFEIVFPDAALREIRISSLLSGARARAASIASTGARWSGDLYLSASVSGRIHAVEVDAGADVDVPDVRLPALQWLDGRFVAPTTLYEPAAGERIVYGSGTVFAVPRLSTDGGDLRASVEIMGATGEQRPRAALAGTLSVGAHRLDYVSSMLLLEGHETVVRASASVDPRAGGAAAPAVSSLLVTDGAGRIATRLTQAGGGTLAFVANGSGDLTRAWFRCGPGEWRPLPLVQLRREGDGIRYAADLAPAIAGTAAEVDLRIETMDAEGDMAVITIEPAFLSGSIVPNPRRRAVTPH